MNLPNKITIARILFIPVFLIFLLAPIPLGEVQIKGIDIPNAHFIAAILFIIASTTNGLDGYYARKYNLITDLGKFLDPLADKLLVAAALIALDRKSTRLNSSHVKISYAVFCLKKKKI